MQFGVWDKSGNKKYGVGSNRLLQKETVGEDSMSESITTVTGVGEAMKAVLAEQGFKTVSDMAKASVDDLAAVRGFGKARAAKAIASAIAILESAGSVAEEPAVVEPSKGEESKKKKKGKKNKKAGKKGKAKSKKKKDKKKRGKSKKKK